MKLRLILGDQLNINHSWFKEKEEDTLYVLIELHQEAQYVVHHIQKIVAFFSAMRHFSQQLKNAGHEVMYFDINSEASKKTLSENLKILIKEKNISKFEYLLPDEHRLDRELHLFCEQIGIPTASYDTEHFLTERNELEKFFDLGWDF